MRLDAIRKQLETYVSKMRKGERHWLKLASAPSAIAVPGIDQPRTISVKRAIYAAFVGDIPQNHEVVPNCKHKYCFCPEHLVLRSSKKDVRPLSFANLETDKKEDCKTPSFDKFPPGISLDAFLAIRNSVSSHRREALIYGVHVKEIVRIRSGLYDATARMETKRLRTINKVSSTRPMNQVSEQSFEEELADFLHQTRE